MSKATLHYDNMEDVRDRLENTVTQSSVSTIYDGEDCFITVTQKNYETGNESEWSFCVDFGTNKVQMLEPVEDEEGFTSDNEVYRIIKNFLNGGMSREKRMNRPDYDSGEPIKVTGKGNKIGSSRQSLMPRYNDEGKIWSDSLDEYVWEKIRYKDGNTYHWDDVNLLYWNDNGDEGDYLMITIEEGLPKNCTPIKNSRKSIKSSKDSYAYAEAMDKVYKYAGKEITNQPIEIIKILDDGKRSGFLTFIFKSGNNTYQMTYDYGFGGEKSGAVIKKVVGGKIESSRKAIKSGYVIKVTETDNDNTYSPTYVNGDSWQSKEPQIFETEEDAQEQAEDFRKYLNKRVRSLGGRWQYKLEVVKSSRKSIKSSSEPSIMIYIRNPETGKWASQAWCNKYQKDPYYYDRAEIIDNPAGYSDEERVIYWGDDINDAMCFLTPERAREYPLKGELYTAEDVPLLGVKLDTIQPLNNSYKSIKSSLLDRFRQYKGTHPIPELSTEGHSSGFTSVKDEFDNLLEWFEENVCETEEHPISEIKTQIEQDKNVNNRFGRRIQEGARAFETWIADFLAHEEAVNSSRKLIKSSGMYDYYASKYPNAYDEIDRWLYDVHGGEKVTKSQFRDYLKTELHFNDGVIDDFCEMYEDTEIFLSRKAIKSAKTLCKKGSAKLIEYCEAGDYGYLGRYTIIIDGEEVFNFTAENRREAVCSFNNYLDHKINNHINNSRKPIKSSSYGDFLNKLREEGYPDEAISNVIADNAYMISENDPYSESDQRDFRRRLKYELKELEERGLYKPVKSSLDDRLIPYLEEFEEGYANAITRDSEEASEFEHVYEDTFFEQFKNDYNLTDMDIRKLEKSVRGIWDASSTEEGEIRDMGEMYGLPRGATSEEALKHFE